MEEEVFLRVKNMINFYCQDAKVQTGYIEGLPNDVGGIDDVCMSPLFRFTEELVEYSGKMDYHDIVYNDDDDDTAWELNGEFISILGLMLELEKPNHWVAHGVKKECIWDVVRRVARAFSDHLNLGDEFPVVDYKTVYSEFRLGSPAD